MKYAALLLLFLFSISSRAADLVRPPDQQGLEAYASKIDDEYSYRQQIDREGATWARELMLLYKWSHKYPTNLRAMPNTPEAKAALELRMRSEFAWLTVTGHGLLATFDFSHADQSLLGSTSRFVKSLMVSSNFWIEVRNQCIEIEELKRKAAGLSLEGGVNIKDCAERLKRDIEISQIVGSNVSLFVGSGIVIGLGKKLFQKYASKWVNARVVPLIPAFAKTRVAMGALLVGVVVVPTAFVVASVTSEQQDHKIFFENLEATLAATDAEAEKASIMRMVALDTERRVLQFAIWVGPRIPKEQRNLKEFERQSKAFMFDLRLTAPGFAKLIEQEAELEATRARIEAELAAIPGISPKLLALAEARRQGSISERDAKLFRSAQYLASLRLTLKLITASKNQ